MSEAHVITVVKRRH